jgi:uncharacterized protein
MYIDLSQLEENELHIEYSYDERFDLRGDEIRLLDAPTIHCRLRRAAPREYRLDGRIVATAETPCDRCLAHFTLPIDVSFEVYYAPIETLAPAEEVPLTQRDLEYGFYRDAMIDVDILVREQILLAMPFRLLCRQDCQGLCPNCGADLNQGLCACHPAAVDARWEGLQELKRKLQ